MTLEPVLAATPWKSNSHLIEDVARLGYLKPRDLILDPTFAKGVWWKRWKPDVPMMTLSDDPESSAYAAGHDFRKLSFPDDYFDAVAYDPPYCSRGSRNPTSFDSMNAHYGLKDAPRTPALLQLLINEGMDECFRVLRPARSKKDGGIMLIKCMSYVSSGEVYPGDFNTYNHATQVLGMTLVDRFLHLTTPRPQDETRPQAHARNNVSTLFVFRKGPA